MKLKMNDDYRYDVDLSQLNAQVEDSNPFSTRELPSINLFNKILRSKLEMKSHMQTLKTGNLFIEFQIDNKGDGVLVPSGISTSEADMWFLNIGDMALFLTDEFLKWIFANQDKYELKPKTNEKTADDHIGHGLIIPFIRILELQIDYYRQIEAAATRKRVNELIYNKNT